MQKIVLVEDNPIDSVIIAAKFNDSAVSVEVVTRLDDLQSQISGAEFELVLLDLNLPTTSGIRSLSCAKQLCPSIPIIVITGFLSADIEQNLLAAGAADVIDKANLASLDLARLVTTTIKLASQPPQ